MVHQRRVLPSASLAFSSPSDSAVETSPYRNRRPPFPSAGSTPVHDDTSTSLNFDSVGNSLGKNSRHADHCSSCSSSFRKLRKSLLLPGIAVLSVLLRTLLNFYWMHQHDFRFDSRILDASVTSLLLRGTKNRSDVNATTVYRRNTSTLDPWSLEDTLLVREEGRKNRRLERQQRTRPPAFNLADQPSSSLKRAMLWKETAIDIDTEKEHDWSALCQAAGLSKKSRVMITGALTAQTGPALALLISKQCGVRNIAGVDAMLPNLRSVRAAAMQVYRMLYRSIDAFQLIVSTGTAGLSRREDELAWLDRLRPTHIVHMETTDALEQSSNLWNDYLSARGQRLYHMQNSVLSLQQLLSYCQSPTENTVSLLHVATVPETTESTHVPATTRIHGMLADFYSTFASKSVRLQHLELPSVFGPTVETQFTSTEDAVFVEDAVAAILIALQQQSGLHRMKIHRTTSRSTNATVVLHQGALGMTNDGEATSRKEIFRRVQTSAYKLDQKHPYGVNKGPHAVYSSDTQGAVQTFRETFGVHKTHFPCASSCNGPTSHACDATVFDNILPISQAATAHCQYAVYLVDFAANLEQLFERLDGLSSKLCRVAFVSAKSPVVQEAIRNHMSYANSTEVFTKQQTLQRFNGKLKSKSWTLVWLRDDDESTLTDAEYALVRMEPSRFFAPSVIKAMFSETAAFAEPPDVALLNILGRIDKPAVQHHFRREYRSGINLSRFVQYPPEKARSVALFTSETPLAYQPKNIAEYGKLAEKSGSVSIPRRQLNYYKHAAHWIQTDRNRPEDESRKTVFHPFPFQWISMGLLVHDMQTEAARILRCSWYDEHLHWGHSNRGADELSLAYVIGMQRIQGGVGPGLEVDATWVPMLDRDSHQPVTTSSGAEVFLRVMTRADES